MSHKISFTVIDLFSEVIAISYLSYNITSSDFPTTSAKVHEKFNKNLNFEVLRILLWW